MTEGQLVQNRYHRKYGRILRTTTDGTFVTVRYHDGDTVTTSRDNVVMVDENGVQR